jgi:hypothetical protein
LSSENFIDFCISARQADGAGAGKSHTKRNPIRAQAAYIEQEALPEDFEWN